MALSMSVMCGLKTRREAVGWSLTELAGRAGIDELSLCDWERGDGSPRLDELEDWAAALGLAFDWVLIQNESRSRLEIDWGKPLVKVDGTTIHLAPMEWKVLERLARTPGELVTQQELFHHLYGDDRRYKAQSTAVRVLITKLRRLLPISIEAQWGQGYVIRGLPSSQGHARSGVATTGAVRIMHTPGDRIRPISKLPQRDPPRLQPLDPGTVLEVHRDAAAPAQVGSGRIEELGVIERFLAERGATRCPDTGPSQNVTLPALIWDKTKKKWLRPSAPALRAG